jgi:hypothetical protein
LEICPDNRRPQLRRFGWRRATLLACAGGWLATASPVEAQELEKVLEIRTEAHEEGAASQSRIDLIADETEDLLRQYREELQQIEALRVYNQQLEKLLESQALEQESTQAQIESVTILGREVTPLMLRMIDSLDQFVSLDVPFLLDERRARVEGLQELMSRSDVTDAERFRRILEAYQIENDFGRTIESYRGMLPDDQGAGRAVDFLRIGRVALLYQTLDGREVGAWNQSDRAWQTLEGSHRPAIRQGLRIAQKQVAPDLLRLPIPAAEEAR